jgi:PAS domain S-box-containing protein
LILRGFFVSKNTKNSTEQSPSLNAPEAQVMEETQAPTRNEQRLSDFAEISTDWFWETDADLRYTFVSDTYEQFTGVKVENILGRTRREMYKSDIPEDVQKWKQFLGTLDRHENVPEFIYRYIRQDGQIRVMRSRARVFFDDDGVFRGYRGTGSDITELSEAREVLNKTMNDLTSEVFRRKQAEQEVRMQRDQLASLNEQKDKFFAIIAHDLKSPYTALLGYTHVLAECAEDMESDQVAEYASIVHRTAEGAFKLLEDLLDWSRLHLGRVEYEPIAFGIGELIDTNLSRFQIVAATKGIDLKSRETPELQVYGDVSMVDTILRNLLSNAIKFTPEGGHIVIEVQSLDGKAHISVADDGVGMSEKRLENLFSLSNTRSTSGTAGEKGTGLGLHLVKELVEKMGGRINAESEVDQGTKFSVYLPLAPT